MQNRYYTLIRLIFIKILKIALIKQKINYTKIGNNKNTNFREIKIIQQIKEIKQKASLVKGRGTAEDG